jgi:hypothetical protein
VGVGWSCHSSVGVEHLPCCLPGLCCSLHQGSFVDKTLLVNGQPTQVGNSRALVVCRAAAYGGIGAPRAVWDRVMCAYHNI